MVRLRVPGLLAGVLVLAAVALGSADLDGVAAVSHHRAGPAVVQDTAILVGNAVEAKTTSGWLTWLAALSSAVALGIGYLSRRASFASRASYAVTRRLVRAGRRAPPFAPAVRMI
jgi:hypothetical protein